jgi:cytochrome c-550 PedF
VFRFFVFMVLLLRNATLAQFSSSLPSILWRISAMPVPELRGSPDSGRDRLPLAQGLQKAPHLEQRPAFTKGVNVQSFLRTLGALSAALVLCVAASKALAHGDVVPQAVDTSGLKSLGSDWQKANPYRKDKTAIRIGDSAYNQNCARCHGLGGVSGGIAPDLRYLPVGDEGDEVFLPRIRKGSVRDGRVYMPPFEGVISQEAMWAIRAWLESVHED